MTLNQLQDFYKKSLTFSCGAGAGKIYVSTKPNPANGICVISPANATLREILRYTGTGTDGSGDYINIADVADRGLGGTTAQAHAIDEPIRMNITAEHWAEMISEFTGKVSTTGDESIDGIKTFLDSPIVPTPTNTNESAPKGYIDSLIASLSSTFTALLGGKVNTTGSETINGVKTFASSPLVPDATTGQQAVSFAQFAAAVIAGGIKATAALFGISRLSVAPVSAVDPIAVGDNDTRLSPATPTNYGIVKIDSFLQKMVSSMLSYDVTNNIIYTNGVNTLVNGDRIKFTPNKQMLSSSNVVTSVDGTTITLTNIRDGDCILIFAQMFQTSFAGSTITDTSGNIYEKLHPTVFKTNFYGSQQIFVCKNAKYAASNLITLSNAQYPSLAGVVIRGHEKGATFEFAFNSGYNDFGAASAAISTQLGGIAFGSLTTIDGQSTISVTKYEPTDGNTLTINSGADTGILAFGVRIAVTPTAPAPINVSNSYYVINSTSNSFKISDTLNGSAIDLTDTGNGIFASLLYETLLNNPLGCFLYQRLTQLLTVGATLTAVNFHQKRYDDNSFFNESNPTRITFNNAGRYLVGATITSATVTDTYITFRLNGTTTIGKMTSSGITAVGSGGNPTLIFDFSVGDYIEVLASGASAPTTSGDLLTNFWVNKIG